MIQHVESEQYLQNSNINSSSSKIAYQVSLDHWFDELLFITIDYKYKSKQLANCILDGDEIIIESSMKDYYLDVADDRPHFLNDMQIDLDKNKFRRDIGIFEIRAKKFQTIFSNMSRVSWRIVLFQKRQKNESGIYGFNLVRLLHTELDATLSSGLRYRSSAPEVYLRSYIGSNENEKFDISSVWEIQPTKSGKMGDVISLQDHQKLGDSEFMR